MSFIPEANMYEGFIYKINNTVNDKVYIGQTRQSVHRRWILHKVEARGNTSKMAIHYAMRKYGIDKFYIITLHRIITRTYEELKKELDYWEQYYIEKYQSLCNQTGYNITKGGKTPCYFTKTPVDQYDVKLNLIYSYDSISEASSYTNIDEQTIRTNIEHRQQTGGGYIWCRHSEKPVKPIYQYEYNIDNVDISKYDPERIVKLMIMGWKGKRVIQYNMFGEIIGVYDDPLDAAEKLGIESGIMYAYISGDKHFNKTTLLYEDEIFDVRREFESIRPISMYDINGNFLMRFRYGKEADDYIGCAEGSVRKAIRSGGTCKGYYFSYYGEEPLMKTKKNDIAVEMRDENNNIIKEFSCQRDIAKFFNLSDTYKPVRKAIKNKTQYKGYYWRYKDETLMA